VFSFVKDFAWAVEDSAVADLSLAIALWIVGSEESMGDLVLGAQARHLPACKVGPVIRDDGMGKYEVTYDVLPEELNNLPHCDIGERYYFCPYFR